MPPLERPPRKRRLSPSKRPNRREPRACRPRRRYEIAQGSQEHQGAHWLLEITGALPASFFLALPIWCARSPRSLADGRRGSVASWEIRPNGTLCGRALVLTWTLAPSGERRRTVSFQGISRISTDFRRGMEQLHVFDGLNHWPAFPRNRDRGHEPASRGSIRTEPSTPGQTRTDRFRQDLGEFAIPGFQRNVGPVEVGPREPSPRGSFEPGSRAVERPQPLDILAQHLLGFLQIGRAGREPVSLARQVPADIDRRLRKPYDRPDTCQFEP